MESADYEPTSEIVLVCDTFLPINFSPAPPSGCRGCSAAFRSAEFVACAHPAMVVARSPD
jgi:hypothetical protein